MSNTPILTTRAPDIQRRAFPSPRLPNRKLCFQQISNPSAKAKHRSTVISPLSSKHLSTCIRAKARLCIPCASLHVGRRMFGCTEVERIPTQRNATQRKATQRK